MSQEESIRALKQKFSSKTHPQKILRQAFEQSSECAIAFSGAEDVVLIDMAVKEVGPERTRVFTLDTGRLHEETCRFIEKVREHYAIEIRVLFPDARAVEKLTREKGLYSFYRDGHKECCAIRKLQPLMKELETLEVWVSGQRRDQNESTRGELEIVESSSTANGKSLVKFNPLSFWTQHQVWDYIHAFDVPYNELHERGFSSIGCAPCTRPVAPGQHERSGRWWWEDVEHKECGLHTETIQAVQR